MITDHQLQYSMHLLYHHLANPLGDLQAHIGLGHHLNDNHQPQIAILASSASIGLVSASARVTSAKFHKAAVERPGPIDRTPETPGSGKIPISRFSSNLFHLLFISTHTSWSVPLHRRCWQGGRIRGTGRSRTSFKCVEETKVRNLSLDGKIFDEEYEPGVKPRCNSLVKPFLCRCHLERWTSIKVSSRKSRRHLLSFDADFLGIR